MKKLGSLREENSVTAIITNSHIFSSIYKEKLCC